MLLTFGFIQVKNALKFGFIQVKSVLKFGLNFWLYTGRKCFDFLALYRPECLGFWFYTDIMLKLLGSALSEYTNVCLLPSLKCYVLGILNFIFFSIQQHLNLTHVIKFVL